LPKLECFLRHSVVLTGRILFWDVLPSVRPSVCPFVRPSKWSNFLHVKTKMFD